MESAGGIDRQGSTGPLLIMGILARSRRGNWPSLIMGKLARSRRGNWPSRQYAFTMGKLAQSRRDNIQARQYGRFFKRAPRLRERRRRDMCPTPLRNAVEAWGQGTAQRYAPRRGAVFDSNNRHTLRGAISGWGLSPRALRLGVEDTSRLRRSRVCGIWSICCCSLTAWYLPIYQGLLYSTEFLKTQVRV